MSSHSRAPFRGAACVVLVLAAVLAHAAASDSVDVHSADPIFPSAGVRLAASGLSAGCCVSGSHAADLTIFTGERGAHALIAARLASSPAAGASILVFGGVAEATRDVEASVAGVKVTRAPNPGRASPARVTAWWGGDAIHGGTRKCFSWLARRGAAGFHPCAGSHSRFPTCAGASSVAGVPVHRFSRSAWGVTHELAVTADECRPVTLSKAGYSRAGVAVFSNSSQVFSDALLDLPAACDGVAPPSAPGGGEAAVDAAGGTAGVGADEGGEALLGAAAGDAPAWLHEAVGSLTF